MPIKSVSVRVDESALDTISDILPEKLGKRYILESWPYLYRRTLAALRGKFTSAELLLMIDVSNGLYLSAGMAGQHLGLQVADAIALDAADAKWSVSATELMLKLDSLSTWEASCIEIWCQLYWVRHNEIKPEEYVTALA